MIAMVIPCFNESRNSLFYFPSKYEECISNWRVDRVQFEKLIAISHTSHMWIWFLSHKIYLLQSTCRIVIQLQCIQSAKQNRTLFVPPSSVRLNAPLSRPPIIPKAAGCCVFQNIRFERLYNQSSSVDRKADTEKCRWSQTRYN